MENVKADKINENSDQCLTVLDMLKNFKEEYLNGKIYYGSLWAKYEELSEKIEKDYVCIKTIEEAEEWTDSNINIPNINYSGFDMFVANQINIELKILQGIFPEVIDNIQYIDTLQNLHKYYKEDKDIDKLIASNFKKTLFKKLKQEKIAINKEKAYQISVNQVTKETKEKVLGQFVKLMRKSIAYAVPDGKYTGIYFNKRFVKNHEILREGIRAAYGKLFRNYIRDLVNHEFCHQLHIFMEECPEVFDLSIVKEMHQICMQKEIKDDDFFEGHISKYTLVHSDEREFFAEIMKRYLIDDKQKKWHTVVGREISRQFEDMRKAKSEN